MSDLQDPRAILIYALGNWRDYGFFTTLRNSVSHDILPPQKGSLSPPYKFVKSLTRSIFALLSLLSFAQAEVFFEDTFDSDGLTTNTATGGGLAYSGENTARWIDDGDATFSSGGSEDWRRALLYSEQSYQSEDGLRLTVYYTTGSVGQEPAHQFSFGLISSDTDLSGYQGSNPFGAETSPYSIGVNLTGADGLTAQGLNFTDGTARTTLDQSGTRVQFAAGQSTKVELEIGKAGYWCYRINDIYEASGVLLEGFDLTKSYHIAAYAQGNDGGGKSIQSIKLEKGYAAGERAVGLRGDWNGGENDLDKMKELQNPRFDADHFYRGSVTVRPTLRTSQTHGDNCHRGSGRKRPSDRLRRSPHLGRPQSR